MSKVLNMIEDGKHVGYAIQCPACNTWHMVDDRWTFNGDYEKPTFQPSINVNANTPQDVHCHSYITDGKIKFLSDCGHAMANMVVDLPDMEE